jgi:hypothetical protein
MPRGAPLVRRLLAFFRGKSIRGGTRIPIALMYTTVVIKELLSVAVKAPT